MTVAGIPSVIAHPHGSVAALAISIIVVGLGTGCLKSNVSVSEWHPALGASSRR